MAEEKIKFDQAVKEFTESAKFVTKENFFGGSDHGGLIGDYAPFMTNTIKQLADGAFNTSKWIKENRPDKSNRNSDPLLRKVMNGVKDSFSNAIRELSYGGLDLKFTRENLQNTVDDLIEGRDEDSNPFDDEDVDWDSEDEDTGASSSRPDTLSSADYYKGIKASAIANIDAINASTSAITRTQLRSADLATQKVISSNMANFAMISKEMHVLDKRLEGINQNLSTMLNFNNSVIKNYVDMMQNHIKASENFMGVTVSYLSRLEAREKQKERELEKSKLADEKKSYVTREGIDWDLFAKNFAENASDTMAANVMGYVNSAVKALGGNVREEFEEAFGYSNFSELISELNPIMHALDRVVPGLGKLAELDEKVYTNIDALTKRIGSMDLGIFDELFDELGQTGQYLKHFITSIGIRQDDANGASGKYYKGATEWTGKDSKALQFVIPNQLANILDSSEKFRIQQEEATINMLATLSDIAANTAVLRTAAIFNPIYDGDTKRKLGKAYVAARDRANERITDFSDSATKIRNNDQEKFDAYGYEGAKYFDYDKGQFKSAKKARSDMRSSAYNAFKNAFDSVGKVINGMAKTAGLTKRDIAPERLQAVSEKLASELFQEPETALTNERREEFFEELCNLLGADTSDREIKAYANKLFNEIVIGKHKAARNVNVETHKNVTGFNANLYNGSGRFEGYDPQSIAHEVAFDNIEKMGKWVDELEHVGKGRHRIEKFYGDEDLEEIGKALKLKMYKASDKQIIDRSKGRRPNGTPYYRDERLDEYKLRVLRTLNSTGQVGWSDAELKQALSDKNKFKEFNNRRNSNIPLVYKNNKRELEEKIRSASLFNINPYGDDDTSRMNYSDFSIWREQQYLDERDKILYSTSYKDEKKRREDLANLRKSMNADMSNHADRLNRFDYLGRDLLGEIDRFTGRGLQAAADAKIKPVRDFLRNVKNGKINRTINRGLNGIDNALDLLGYRMSGGDVSFEDVMDGFTEDELEQFADNYDIPSYDTGTGNAGVPAPKGKGKFVLAHGGEIILNQDESEIWRQLYDKDTKNSAINQLRELATVNPKAKILYKRLERMSEDVRDEYDEEERLEALKQMMGMLLTYKYTNARVSQKPGKNNDRGSLGAIDSTQNERDRNFFTNLRWQIATDVLSTMYDDPEELARQRVELAYAARDGRKTFSDFKTKQEFFKYYKENKMLYLDKREEIEKMMFEEEDKFARIYKSFTGILGKFNIKDNLKLADAGKFLSDESLSPVERLTIGVTEIGYNLKNLIKVGGGAALSSGKLVLQNEVHRAFGKRLANGYYEGGTMSSTINKTISNARAFMSEFDGSQYYSYSEETDAAGNVNPVYHLNEKDDDAILAKMNKKIKEFLETTLDDNQVLEPERKKQILKGYDWAYDHKWHLIFGGGIGGLLLSAQLGPILGPLAGASVAGFAVNERFKDWFLGERDEETGKRSGGKFAELKKALTEGMTNLKNTLFSRNIVETSNGQHVKAYGGILGPVVQSLESNINNIFNFVDKTLFDNLALVGIQLGNDMKKNAKSFFDSAKDVIKTVFDPVTKATDFAVKGLIGVIDGSVKNILGFLGKPLNKMGQKAAGKTGPGLLGSLYNFFAGSAVTGAFANESWKMFFEDLGWGNTSRFNSKSKLTGKSKSKWTANSTYDQYLVRDDEGKLVAGKGKNYEAGVLEKLNNTLDNFDKKFGNLETVAKTITSIIGPLFDPITAVLKHPIETVVKGIGGGVMEGLKMLVMLPMLPFKGVKWAAGKIAKGIGNIKLRKDGKTLAEAWGGLKDREMMFLGKRPTNLSTDNLAFQKAFDNARFSVLKRAGNADIMNDAEQESTKWSTLKKIDKEKIASAYYGQKQQKKINAFVAKLRKKGVDPDHMSADDAMKLKALSGDDTVFSWTGAEWRKLIYGTDDAATSMLDSKVANEAKKQFEKDQEENMRKLFDNDKGVIPFMEDTRTFINDMLKLAGWKGDSGTQKTIQESTVDAVIEHEEKKAEEEAKNEEAKKEKRNFYAETIKEALFGSSDENVDAASAFRSFFSTFSNVNVENGGIPIILGNATVIKDKATGNMHIEFALPETKSSKKSKGSAASPARKKISVHVANRGNASPAIDTGDTVSSQDANASTNEQNTATTATTGSTTSTTSAGGEQKPVSTNTGVMHGPSISFGDEVKQIIRGENIEFLVDENGHTLPVNALGKLYVRNTEKGSDIYDKRKWKAWNTGDPIEKGWEIVDGNGNVYTTATKRIQNYTDISRTKLNASGNVHVDFASLADKSQFGLRDIDYSIKRPLTYDEYRAKMGKITAYKNLSEDEWNAKYNNYSENQYGKQFGITAKQYLDDLEYNRNQLGKLGGISAMLENGIDPNSIKVNDDGIGKTSFHHQARNHWKTMNDFGDGTNPLQNLVVSGLKQNKDGSFSITKDTKTKYSQQWGTQLLQFAYGAKKKIEEDGLTASIGDIFAAGKDFNKRRKEGKLTKNEEGKFTEYLKLLGGTKVGITVTVIREVLKRLVAGATFLTGIGFFMTKLFPLIKDPLQKAFFGDPEKEDDGIWGWLSKKAWPDIKNTITGAWTGLKGLIFGPDDANEPLVTLLGKNVPVWIGEGYKTVEPMINKGLSIVGSLLNPFKDKVTIDLGEDLGPLEVYTLFGVIRNAVIAGFMSQKDTADDYMNDEMGLQSAINANKFIDISGNTELIEKYKGKDGYKETEDGKQYVTLKDDNGNVRTDIVTQYRRQNNMTYRSSNVSDYLYTMLAQSRSYNVSNHSNVGTWGIYSYNKNTIKRDDSSTNFNFAGVDAINDAKLERYLKVYQVAASKYKFKNKDERDMYDIGISICVKSRFEAGPLAKTVANRTIQDVYLYPFLFDINEGVFVKELSGAGYAFSIVSGTINSIGEIGKQIVRYAAGVAGGPVGVVANLFLGNVADQAKADINASIENSDHSYTSYIVNTNANAKDEYVLGSAEGYYGPGHFTQTDPRWARAGYGKFRSGKASTIGAGGCGPTALANVMNNVYGSNVTNPASMAKFASSNGYGADGGTSAGLFTSGARKLGLSSESINKSGNSIVNSLRRGKNVIVAGRGGSAYTRAGHIMSVRGLDGRGNAIVDDPMRVKSRHIPLKSLTNGMTHAWSIGRGIGYGGTILGDEYSFFTDVIGDAGEGIMFPYDSKYDVACYAKSLTGTAINAYSKLSGIPIAELINKIEKSTYAKNLLPESTWKDSRFFDSSDLMINAKEYINNIIYWLDRITGKNVSYDVALEANAAYSALNAGWPISIAGKVGNNVIGNHKGPKHNVSLIYNNGRFFVGDNGHGPANTNRIREVSGDQISAVLNKSDSKVWAITDGSTIPTVSLPVTTTASSNNNGDNVQKSTINTITGGSFDSVTTSLSEKFSKAASIVSTLLEALLSGQSFSSLWNSRNGGSSSNSIYSSTDNTSNGMDSNGTGQIGKSIQDYLNERAEKDTKIISRHKTTLDFEGLPKDNKGHPKDIDTFYAQLIYNYAIIYVCDIMNLRGAAFDAAFNEVTNAKYEGAAILASHKDVLKAGLQKFIEYGYSGQLVFKEYGGLYKFCHDLLSNIIAKKLVINDTSDEKSIETTISKVKNVYVSLNSKYRRGANKLAYTLDEIKSMIDRGESVTINGKQISGSGPDNVVSKSGGKSLVGSWGTSRSDYPAWATTNIKGDGSLDVFDITSTANLPLSDMIAYNASLLVPAVECGVPVLGNLSEDQMFKAYATVGHDVNAPSFGLIGFHGNVSSSSNAAYPGTEILYRLGSSGSPLSDEDKATANKFADQLLHNTVNMSSLQEFLRKPGVFEHLVTVENAMSTGLAGFYLRKRTKYGPSPLEYYENGVIKDPRSILALASIRPKGPYGSYTDDLPMQTTNDELRNVINHIESRTWSGNRMKRIYNALANNGLMEPGGWDIGPLPQSIQNAIPAGYGAALRDSMMNTPTSEIYTKDDVFMGDAEHPVNVKVDSTPTTSRLDVIINKLDQILNCGYGNTSHVDNSRSTGYGSGDSKTVIINNNNGNAQSIDKRELTTNFNSDKLKSTFNSISRRALTYAT